MGRVKIPPSNCHFSITGVWQTEDRRKHILKVLNYFHFHWGAKYWIPKPSTCRATKTWTIVASSRKQLRKVERGSAFYFDVFPQIHNLSHNKFARALANQPISGLHFFNPQQMFFVAGQVDYARWKTRNMDQNLRRNNVARLTSWGFLNLVFRRLKTKMNGFSWN